MVHEGVRNILQSQEEFLKDDQIYFCKFLSFREVWYINFYVLCETNPIVSSKSLIDIILGIRKILHGSGRVPERWPDLLLTIFELQRSVIYQFECTLQYKSNGLVKITYGYHSWCQEDHPWIRKGSWSMTRSTFVNFRATEKCDILICMYFVRQIHLYGQNDLWTSSLVSGRSSMDQEGFLNDDQKDYVPFFATYKSDMSICMYFARQIQWCDQNNIWTSSIVSGRSFTDNCIRKGSWMVTRSTFVIASATE